MKAGLLLKFLKTCPPKMEVGITVVSKEGAQFWGLDGLGMSVFKAPDGQKCVSLLEARRNDPFPKGAIIESNSTHFDDAPMSIDSIQKEISARFDFGDLSNDMQLNDDETADVIFETIHGQIGDLIRINNSLLCYVKNKYKKQKEYWIEVKKPEGEQNEKVHS